MADQQATPWWETTPNSPPALDPVAAGALEPISIKNFPKPVPSIPDTTLSDAVAPEEPGLVPISLENFPKPSGFAVTPKPGIVGTLIRRTIPEILPSAAGMATASETAAIGGEAGLLGGPFAWLTVPAGELIGAGVGFYMGHEAAARGQAWTASTVIPDRVLQMTGQDATQKYLDENTNPLTAWVATYLPQLAFMGPFPGAKAAVREGATALERLLQSTWGQKGVSAAVMGSFEALQEKFNQVDNEPWFQPWKVLFATSFGAFAAHQTKLGAAMDFEHLGGWIRTHTNEDITRVLGSPKDITVSKAKDALIIGPGITDPAFRREEEIKQELKDQHLREELGRLARVTPVGPPDIHAVVRRVDPGLFALHDKLEAQAENLRTHIANIRAPTDEHVQALEKRWLELQNRSVDMRTGGGSDLVRRQTEAELRDTQNQIDLAHERRAVMNRQADTPELTSLTGRLRAIENQLHDMGPQVRDAYARAGEAHGALFEPPLPQPAPEGGKAPVAPPEGGLSPVSRETYRKEGDQIAADIEKQLIAAGRPPDEAKAGGVLDAPTYVSTAILFNGKLGSPADIYRAEGAIIRGGRKPKGAEGTGLAGLGKMGSAITDNMYKMLWDKVQKGDTTELGKPSALLQAAAAVRQRGGVQTIGQFKALAEDYAGIKRGRNFQNDMQTLVARHSTPAMITELAQERTLNQELPPSDTSSVVSRETQPSSAVQSLIMTAQRGERVVASKVRIAKEELAHIDAAAEAVGLPKKEVRDQVTNHKLAHPAEQGWAPLVLNKIDKKVSDNGTVKYTYVYTEVPYAFNTLDGSGSLEPGTPAYTARVEAIGKSMAEEIRNVFRRALAGDTNAQNILAHAGWYKAMRARLRQEFGGLGDLMADLLGATSPQTPVRENWKNAIDVLRRASRGDLDQRIQQWADWAEKVDNLETNFRAWINEKIIEFQVREAERATRLEAAYASREEARRAHIAEQRAAGRKVSDITKSPEYKAIGKDEVTALREEASRYTEGGLKASPEFVTKLEELRAARDEVMQLLPTKEAGPKYGATGRNIVNAMVGLWRKIKNEDTLTGRSGTKPKAINFSGNLIGFRSRATIDVWAARMLQRLAGFLRIPSMAEGTVSGAMREDATTTLQFGFGQDAFSDAVKRIRSDPEMSKDKTLADINDDDLQALVWFVEKEIWTVNDWTNAAGEGGSFELEANLTGSEEQGRIKELRRFIDSSAETLKANRVIADVQERAAQQNIIDNPAASEADKKAASKKIARIDAAQEKAKAKLIKIAADKEKAKADLAALERTVDRFVGGLSIQHSQDMQGTDFVPTDADMAQLGNRLRAAVYTTDNRATVLGSKMLSTEGRYGSVERALDLEVIGRQGYNPNPLWRQMLEEAQQGKQDSTFLSRVLRSGETVDHSRHRPGVEIYFREAAAREQLEKVLADLSKEGVDFLTVIVDGRRMPGYVAGEMPPAVGVRFQYVPEFEQRYGMDDLSGLNATELAQKMKDKGDELDALANRVTANVPGVSFAARFWHDTQVAFATDYQEKLDALATGVAQGEPGQAGSQGWTGHSVSEGVANANRHVRETTLGKPGGQPGDVLGRDAQGLTLYQGVDNQTETPAFKEWFGDSKIVDESGKPLVVYHGTTADGLEAFSSEDAPYRGGLLAFFTSSKKFANDYATKNEGAHVIPVYLKIEKPFDFRKEWDMAKTFYEETGGVSDDEEANRILMGLNKLPKGEDIFTGPGASALSEADFVKAVKSGSWDALENNEFVEWLHAGGYDGLVMRENKAVNYAVFDPTQIKSAIGNTGAFDPNDPRILAQQARGKITLRPGQRPIMTLMTRANASTFIHEVGHHWLDRMIRYALHPDAPESLKIDVKTVRDWLGNKGEPITVRQHEQWARGVEQYARDGHAPSARLAKVFAQFKTWLTAIYKSAKELGTPITPEIRKVLDRWIEAEPHHAVIVPERTSGPSLADIHTADALHTPPHDAEPEGDRVIAEADRAVTDVPPEIANELTAATDAWANEGGAQPPAETGAGPAGAGQVVGGGGQPQPVAGGGPRGDQPGAVVSGGGGAVPQGAGVGGKPATEPTGPVPTVAHAPFAPTSENIDKAGNVRLENLTPENIREVFHEAAEANNDFLVNRRGIISDQMVMDLAEAAGLDPRNVRPGKIGQAYSAEAIMQLRLALLRSGTVVFEAMKKAQASKTEADVMAYAQVKETHRLLQGQLSGATAEAGRALRAFRNIRGSKQAQDIDKFLREATGKTLYQLQREIEFGAMLKSPASVSQFILDSSKRNFGNMMLEYWINGLISGPATHITYMIGNSLLAAEHMTVITPLAAGIGKLRELGGRQGERVRIGEVIPQVVAFAGRGSVSGIHASLEALRSGTTVTLPGGKPRELPFQTGMAAEPTFVNPEAGMHEIAGSIFSMMEGIKDAVTVSANAPLISLEPSALGSIPDIRIKGATLPTGTAARLPGRLVGSIHGFYNAANYVSSIAAQAFRMATEERLTGTAFNARIAELKSHPTEEMMTKAREHALDVTLMGKVGQLTQWISRGVNMSLPKAPENVGGPVLRAAARLANATVTQVPFLRFIDPFVHIGSSITSGALLKRTPLGLLSPAILRDLSGMNGNVAADQAAARMIAGTSLMALYGFLRAQNLISGSGPDNKYQAAMWRQAGNQPHSVRLGEFWYQSNRLGILGMHMSIAADLYDVVHLASQGDFERAGGALQMALTQTILDEGWAKGPADLLAALENKMGERDRYIRNFLASFVPYSVGMAQIDRATDPTTRWARNLTDAMKQKLPWASESLWPKVDIWGQDVPNKDAAFAPGVTSIYVSQISRDPVNIAMLQAGVYPAPVGEYLRNVKLTPEQYDFYARTAGRSAKMALDKLVQEPSFMTASVADRHDRMVTQINFSRHQAANAVLVKWHSIVEESHNATLAPVIMEDVVQ